MTCSQKSVPISLEHREQLTALWKSLCLKENVLFAEYSFANAFLFRRQHRYEVLEGSPLVVKGEFSPGKPYYIPTRPLKENFKSFSSDKIPFFPIPEEWLPNVASANPQLKFCRQDSDYIFRVDKLKTLAGRALSSRRNLLHQFENQYAVEARIFSEDEILNAQRILEAWQTNSQQPKEQTDYYSCLDAFEHFKLLELMGCMAYANEVPVGFAIGGLLTPQVAVLHLSKTLHAYKGVTPFLYQHFAQLLPHTVEWINLEQDLGISSLRKAKEAYDPDLLKKKWRVTF